MSNFSKSYGFKNITSSPHYPQSSGEAERAVQTIKRLLDKSTDPYLALLAYRSSPLKLGYSPAELLMGRNLRTTLPTANSHFKAHTPDEDAVKKRDKKLKESQRKNYNHRHRAKEQRSLITGDLVWIIDLQRQGTIIRDESPRSYTVQTHNGIIRRNQRHLNNLPETAMRTKHWIILQIHQIQQLRRIAVILSLPIPSGLDEVLDQDVHQIVMVYG